jgi:hypothetical protein
MAVPETAVREVEFAEVLRAAVQSGMALPGEQQAREDFEELFLGRQAQLLEGVLRAPGRPPLRVRFSVNVFLQRNLNHTLGVGRFKCRDLYALAEMFELGGTVILEAGASESVIRLTNAAGSFVARGSSAIKLMR